MVRHRLWLVVAVFLFAPDAFAQTGGNPFDARYKIRGVDPYDYLGYRAYSDSVRALVVQQKLALPLDEKGEAYSAGLADFTVATEEALRVWNIRRLRVRLTRSAQAPDTVDVHLAWPSDVRALATAFPFRAVRQAFAASTLAPDSAQWIAQRNSLLPDPAVVAAKIAVSDVSLDVAKCPRLLADLRQLRDAPPSLALIEPTATLSDAPNQDIVVTADGWGIALVWNGGPSQFGGGRASPDQSSDLGVALLDLVGDAETCAGLRRTVR